MEKWKSNKKTKKFIINFIIAIIIITIVIITLL